MVLRSSPLRKDLWDRITMFDMLHCDYHLHSLTYKMWGSCTNLVLDWQEYCRTQNKTMKCSKARQVNKNLCTPLQKSRHHFWNIRTLAWMHNILYKRLWNQMCGTRVSTGQTVWFGDRLSDFKTDCLTGKHTVSSWVRLSRSMPSKPVKRLRAICDPAQASRKRLHVVICQRILMQTIFTYILPPKLYMWP